MGIESDESQDLCDLEDYQALFHRYERAVLVNETEALNEIAGWVKSGECVALTCFESKPEYCHRTRVANAVEKLIGSNATAL
jgi:uncharacterized protein (DUF488 family)